MRVDVLTKEYPPEIYGGAGVHVAELVRALRRPRRPRPPGCTPSARRATRTARRRTPTSPSSRTPTAPSRRSASTWRSPTAAPAPTWCTRTPGTPTSPATSPGCCTASRTSSPRTPSSRCGRGRPSSSAAATPSPRGSSARPTRPRPPSSRSRPRCATTCCASYPAIDPDRVAGRAQRHRHRAAGRPTHDPDRVRVAGRRPGPAVGRLRRADHPAEGAAALPARGRPAAARGPGRALRGRAGHPGDRGRGDRRSSTGCAQSRDGVVWIRDMLPRADVVALLTAATVFACPSIYEPLGIVNLEAMACETAVVATATGGIPEVVVPTRLGTDGPARRWSRSSRPPTAPAPRSTPTATSPTSPPRSPRSSPTPTGPPRWARPAGSAPSTPSAGPRSPSRPWRSTGPPPAELRSVAARASSRDAAAPGDPVRSRRRPRRHETPQRSVVEPGEPLGEPVSRPRTRTGRRPVTGSRDGC